MVRVYTHERNGMSEKPNIFNKINALASKSPDPAYSFQPQAYQKAKQKEIPAKGKEAYEDFLYHIILRRVCSVHVNLQK